MDPQNKTHRPGPRSEDYFTLVEQACAKVAGFSELYSELERAICINNKSISTLNNYGRHLAHLALHYTCLPTDLTASQVMNFLQLAKSRGTTSATFFKFTVYGLRFVCKLRGLPYQQFGLPAIDHDGKLPVVLSPEEVRRLLKCSGMLKHRLIIAMLYGCGLRCAEVRGLAIADVDLHRAMVHVRQGKGNKDRYVPLGPMLIRGIGNYLQSEKPVKWLFEGAVPGECLSQRATQSAVTNAVKRAGILKTVSTHTLRHTYATHLLEQGVNIVRIKELLGHASIETTMVYLHVAQPGTSPVFSPLDTLYSNK